VNGSGPALLAYHLASVLRPDAARVLVEPWNRPRPFKLYEGLEAFALPPSGTALAAAGSSDPPAALRAPDLQTLSVLLHWSAGIVRRRRLANGSVMQFRAASCTGALYHVEVYAVCPALDGLPAGIYHYAPQTERLERLRSGDCRGRLAAACAGSPELAGAPLALVLTSEFWRNGWRYGERAYRHAFWDAGTILANLMALAEQLGLPAYLVTAFDDAAVNRLIGVDGTNEPALAVLGLGGGAPAPAATVPIESLAPRTVPSSPRPRPLPAIAAAHRSSSLSSHPEVVHWRAAAVAHAARAHSPLVRTVRLPEPIHPDESVPAIIARRGSARRFAPEPASRQAMSAIVRAAGAVPSGDAWPYDRSLCKPLLIVRAVDGVAPGLYRVLSDGALMWLAADHEIGSIAALVPDGARAERGAATIWWTVDLARLLGRLGGRGYRAAQLEAGVALGRVYLAATAHGLGVTGLTYFDDEAAQCFAPWLPRRSIVLAAAAGAIERASAPPAA